jgi:hypothetical protein
MAQSPLVHESAASGARMSTTLQRALFEQETEQLSAELQATPVVHVSPALQTTLQRSAVHVMGEWHEPPPLQVTLHAAPLHVTLPWHESPPVHWMSQDLASWQLMAPWHWPPPHFTTQLWPTGHVGAAQPPTELLVQSMVQMLLPPQVPPTVMHCTGSQTLTPASSADAASPAASVLPSCVAGSTPVSLVPGPPSVEESSSVLASLPGTVFSPVPVLPRPHAKSTPPHESAMHTLPMIRRRPIMLMVSGSRIHASVKCCRLRRFTQDPPAYG